ARVPRHRDARLTRRARAAGTPRRLHRGGAGGDAGARDRVRATQPLRPRAGMPSGRAGAALALTCAASATALVLLGTRLTFFGDDWAFLLQRPGFSADSLLDDHNGHLSVLPVL